MPLWTIHHSADAFADQAQKDQIASAITDIYTAVGLPKFYVVVLFAELSQGSAYVGGELAESLVRIVVDHIARHAASPEQQRAIANKASEVLRPFIPAQAHWELHIDETPELLWTINGIIPPPMKSAAEQEWARTNVAAPYAS